jgi:hypothetical protein
MPAVEPSSLKQHPHAEALTYDPGQNVAISDSESFSRRHVGTRLQSLGNI